jgi:hypothetical protein
MTANTCPHCGGSHVVRNGTKRTVSVSVGYVEFVVDPTLPPDLIRQDGPR